MLGIAEATVGVLSSQMYRLNGRVPIHRLPKMLFNAEMSGMHDCGPHIPSCHTWKLSSGLCSHLPQPSQLPSNPTHAIIPNGRSPSSSGPHN